MVLTRDRRPDGTPISRFALAPFIDRGAIAQCPRCLGEWRVFAPEADVRPPPQTATTVTLRETARVLEPLGREARVIDNSRSDVTSVRRMVATHRWLRRCDVEVERSESTASGLCLTPSLLVDLKAEVTSAVSGRYAKTWEEENLFEEEIEVTVPGRTAVEVVLDWKRVWQRGTAVCTLPHGGVVQIPYGLVVGVTFDQEIRDLER
ncbi:hypothetical protein ACI78Q_14760 [Geodermatophilus sp. SYSU D00705]